MKWVIEAYFADNPTGRCVLFTPWNRYRSNGTYDLNGIRSAILDVGAFYNLPVLDLMREIGINQYNLSSFSADGIHPDDPADSIMATHASQFLNGL
jgi:hypothetical protein